MQVVEPELYATINFCHLRVFQKFLIKMTLVNKVFNIRYFLTLLLIN